MSQTTSFVVRRIKQGVAEWFRLQLKEKNMERASRNTPPEGWNIGPVPYGYLHGPGDRTRTRSKPLRAVLKPAWCWTRTGPPSWRRSTPGATVTSSAINTITARLNADPATYPAADPSRRIESLGGVSAILGNPKYTGYQVFGRRRRKAAFPVPADPNGTGHRSRPTPRSSAGDMWDAAQAAGAENGKSQDGDAPNSHPRHPPHLHPALPGAVQTMPAAHVRHHPHPP